MDTEAIFRWRAPCGDRLRAAGFVCTDGAWRKTIPILNKQFDMAVVIGADGAVYFHLFGRADGEEYVLVHVEHAQGRFVGEVRAACEAVLTDIAEQCFTVQTLQAEQTRRLLAYVEKRYGAAPEFLWEKSPDCAAIRRPDNKKWFAVLMTVERSRLGFDAQGTAEILDLKGAPADIVQRLDGERFLRAYHMNKQHWFTVCLDGRVPDETLFDLTDESWQQAGR